MFGFEKSDGVTGQALGLSSPFFSLYVERVLFRSRGLVLDAGVQR